MFTEIEKEIFESELNYVSFKRTTQYKGEYLTIEMSANINPELGESKTFKGLTRKVNYHLQEIMKYIDSPHDVVNNYKNK